MLETGWSWREFCELPDGYLPVLVKILNKRAKQPRLPAGRRNR